MAITTNRNPIAKWPEKCLARHACVFYFKVIFLPDLNINMSLTKHALTKRALSNLTDYL